MVRPPPPLLDTGAADDLNTLRRGSCWLTPHPLQVHSFLR